MFMVCSQLFNKIPLVAKVIANSEFVGVKNCKESTKGEITINKQCQRKDE